MEGIPLSLLEAMACGVPPVVTDVGANANILGPGLAQNLPPAGDVTQICAALERLVRSPEDRRGAGRPARARIVERYSLARMVEEYERVYRA